MKPQTRRTLRTAVQALVALCVLLPVLVEQLGLDASAAWLAAPLAVAAVVARVMASPLVEAWLRRYVPWLAAGDAVLVEQEPGRNTGARADDVEPLAVPARRLYWSPHGPPRRHAQD